MNAGIDYGLGRTNIDQATGIRYGVIPANDLGESWYESSEPDYGPPMCHKCGNEAVEIDNVPFDLDDCKTVRQDGYFRKHDVLRIPKEHCDECGGKREWHDEGRDYACLGCARSFDSDDAFAEEAIGGFSLDDGECKAHQGHDDSDVFILESPYYTRARFCSPCAPGAAYLRNPCEDGPKAYCFDPSWFRPWNDDQVTGEYAGERTSCPYPVWRVSDDELVFQPQT